MISLRTSMVAVAIFALSVPAARCESSDCANPVLIVSDGRISQSSYPQGASYWYGIYALAGHSYSAEFEPPADNYVSASRVQFGPISVFAPNDNLVACRGVSTVAVTQTSGYVPVILKGTTGAGRRISFTAQSSGLYRLSVTNSASTGSYSFRAVDTTLFSPRWSTWSGYDTQWGFMNASDMNIDGVLRVFDLSANLMATVPLTIPGGGYLIRTANSPGISLPRNSAGYVIFSHNGPPGALLADSYMVNAAATVVVPSKFEAGGER